MIWLTVITIKMSIVAGIGLLTAAATPRRSAALRHWLLAAALVSAAAVPLVARLGPTWTMPVAATTISARTPQVAITLDMARESSAAATQTTVQHRESPVEWATRAVTPLWLMGAAINLLLLCMSMLRLHRAAGQMASMSCQTWTEELRRVARTLGIKRHVRLLVGDHHAMLVTWGFVSPRIVLPRGAAEWSRVRVHVVLAHELAHVARGDWVVQMGAELLRSVFWFNPVLWLACARLRHESERACDDVVVAAGVDCTTYASQLLELARLLGAERRAWFTAPAITGRPSGLERRINAMFDTRLGRAPLTRGARAVVLAGFAAIALPLAAFAQGAFGSLSGTVTDQMNRVLPDVEVTIVDNQQHASHVVHTDRNGHFQLLGLVPGTYRVDASMPGFQPTSTTVNVDGGAVERDIALEIGELHETMTVTSATGPAHISDAIPARAIPRCPTASPVGGDIRAPRMIRNARPAYAGVDGVVTLIAVISADGSIGDVRVVKSDSPALEGPAIDAVRQWQFDSTLLNCVPVPVKMNVTMLFRQQ